MRRTALTAKLCTYMDRAEELKRRLKDGRKGAASDAENGSESTGSARTSSALAVCCALPSAGAQSHSYQISEAASDSRGDITGTLDHAGGTEGTEPREELGHKCRSNGLARLLKRFPRGNVGKEEPPKKSSEPNAVDDHNDVCRIT
ncbi:unnamed protein product [Leptidea sinapis]|nr:unnamed protein product [Leptidea sinapis]